MRDYCGIQRMTEVYIHIILPCIHNALITNIYVVIGPAPLGDGLKTISNKQWYHAWLHALRIAQSSLLHANTQQLEAEGRAHIYYILLPCLHVILAACLIN
jgi:hypothetical protein